MNLEDLKRVIDKTIEINKGRKDPKEINVVVTLSDPSVGPRAYTKIKYASLGIDWENNQFRLEPEEKIVKMKK